MGLSDEALVGKLRAVDEAVWRAHGPLQSLSPERTTATHLHDIGKQICAMDLPPRVLAVLGEGLLEIVEAQCQNFPENIFWDLDFLATSLIRRSRDSDLGPVRYIQEATRTIVSLQALFGIHSPIRFRYVHDFLYGFDWARWVKRDPNIRGSVQPFDIEFLRYSRERGHELIHLIEEGDERYPALDAGNARNPFPFSREPSDESLLHRDLAEQGMIPVCAWNPDAAPVWNENYADFRIARARELSLNS